MDSTSETSKRTAIVRIKRKATDSAADTLCVPPFGRQQAAVLLTFSTIQQ